jgi:hypothetical protein
MGESLSDAPCRVLTFPVAPEAGFRRDVSTTVVETSGEPPSDCPRCGRIGSATVFRTVYTVYFFCSACASGWSVDQLLTRGRTPERRRVRAHQAFGEHSA